MACLTRKLFRFQNICYEGETFEDPYDSDDDDDDANNNVNSGVSDDGEGKSYYLCERNTKTGRLGLVRNTCDDNQYFINKTCTPINPEPKPGKPPSIPLTPLNNYLTIGRHELLMTIQLAAFFLRAEQESFYPSSIVFCDGILFGWGINRPLA